MAARPIRAARSEGHPLYRTDRGRFALDEEGSWQPSIKTTIATPREACLSVAYLCGLLNSELLDLWYAVRGKVPWHDRRNYEPKPMNAMPYRHVAVPDGWAPGSLVAGLESALGGDDEAGILRAAVAIGAAVGSPAGDADALRAVEQLVRAVAANRRALLPLRAVAPELRRAIKNPWRTHGVEVDPLPWRRCSRWRRPPLRGSNLSLTLTVQSDGPVGRPTIAGSRLTFWHARRVTATVDGPPERLAVVAAATRPSLATPDLAGVVLPKDLTTLVEAVSDAARRVEAGLQRGRTLVEAVERVVCALYGVDPKLTEQVVASAVVRAGASGESDEQ